MENNRRLLNSKLSNDFKKLNGKYTKLIQKEFSEIINRESFQNSKVSGSDYFKKGQYNINIKHDDQIKADKSVSKSPRFYESNSYVLNKTKDFINGVNSKKQHSSKVASDYMELNGSYRKKIDYNINTGIRSISSNKSRNQDTSLVKSTTPTWQALINKGSTFFTSSIKTYNSSKMEQLSHSMTPSSRRVIYPDSFPGNHQVSSKKFFKQSSKVKQGIIAELVSKTPIDDFSGFSKKKVLANKSRSQINFGDTSTKFVDQTKSSKRGVDKNYFDAGLAGLSTHNKNVLSNRSIENRILLQSSSTMSELINQTPTTPSKNLADMIK